MTRRELSVSLVTKLRNKAFRRELKEESNRQGDELDLIITSVLEGKKTKKKSEQREAEKNVQEAIQEKKGEGKRGWKDYLSFGEDPGISQNGGEVEGVCKIKKCCRNV